MWQGQVVVITGASSGIGAELAKQISHLGAIPVLMARSQERLEQVTESLSGIHASYVLDVTSDVQVELTMQKVLERFGQIDILVNNAGYAQFDSFIDTSMAQFVDMMDVNYLGAVRCTKVVLPHMLAQRRGHIVNVASLAGKIGSAKSTAYSATKHALLGFTNSLRAELMDSGVTISAVNPGPVDTPFFDRADPGGGYVERVRWFMLKPGQVAKAIIRVIELKKSETNLPMAASIGVKLFQMFPVMLEKVANKLLNQK